VQTGRALDGSGQLGAVDPALLDAKPKGCKSQKWLSELGILTQPLPGQYLWAKAPGLRALCSPEAAATVIDEVWAEYRLIRLKAVTRSAGR
jgi:hypothetical protein